MWLSWLWNSYEFQTATEKIKDHTRASKYFYFSSNRTSVFLTRSKIQYSKLDFSFDDVFICGTCHPVRPGLDFFVESVSRAVGGDGLSVSDQSVVGGDTTDGNSVGDQFFDGSELTTWRQRTLNFSKSQKLVDQSNRFTKNVVLLMKDPMAQIPMLLSLNPGAWAPTLAHPLPS